MRFTVIAALAFGLAAALSAPWPAAAQSDADEPALEEDNELIEADRHSGYYYPVPQTREVWRSRAQTLPDSDRRRRLGFVINMTTQMLGNPYPPPFAMFAKGTDAEKLIIVNLYDGSYNTLYRMRALLAMLTATARATPVFQEFGVEEIFTFFELAKMMGFSQITFTDGDKFAHQVEIE